MNNYVSPNDSCMENIPSCSDWSESAAQQRLINLRKSYKEQIESLIKQANFISPKKGLDSNLENGIRNFETEETAIYTKHSDTLKYYEENLKPEIKNFKVKEKELIADNKALTVKMSKLEEEEEALTVKLKLEREAYQKAIHMYSTYFDMNIDINDSSDGVITASIAFGSSKDMEPVKVVIDEKNKKIMSVGSMDNETSHQEIFGPEFLYNLRESIIKNNVN